MTISALAAAARGDAIAALAGLAEDHPLRALRSHRHTATLQAQRSHEVLLVAPPEESLPHFSLPERHAVALFTALLHGSEAAVTLYREALLGGAAEGAAATAEAVAALAARALLRQPHGPWGHYPKGPLSAADQPGEALAPTAQEADALGQRLAAALAHVHLLVQHPRDAAPKALQRLVAAGWSSTGIVTLSQLVAFLAFQLRVAHGLGVLAAHPLREAA